jgi:hypothetical protein
MTHEAVVDRDWHEIVERLGGTAALEASARETKAFLRARVVDSAVSLLRLILAYCLSERGLRSTAAWATSIGLVDISNVALLYRLRQCGDWLAVLVGRALAAAAPQASRGRLLRIVDATTVPKAGTFAKTKNGLVRLTRLEAGTGSCSRLPSSARLLANGADFCSRSLPLTACRCSHYLPACSPTARRARHRSFVLALSANEKSA